MTPALPSTTHPDKWQLVWSDEFDDAGLPDATKWDYEEGFVRNSERQYYTRQRSENARVEGGKLVIELRNDQFVPPSPQISPWAQVQDRPRPGQAVPFTSASLITRNKASWKYGRVEVRAQVPSGRGVWPAIWMLGDSFSRDADWPACGEIDIMEFIGNEPGHIHGTMHFAANGAHAKLAGKRAVPVPHEGFHTYAIEWTPERVDFLFNDEIYHSVALEDAGDGRGQAFRRPFFLMLGLAFGGTWGGTIDGAALPQRFLIDHVRVYQAAQSEVQIPPGGDRDH